MSRIGSYNLELQEQANELGFSTTQEALEAGCVIEGDCDQPKLVDPLTAAHNALQKEKEEVLVELGMLSDNLTNGSEAQRAVERAIKLIETEVK